jgi:6-phosphogluconolactonase
MRVVNPTRAEVDVLPDAAALANAAAERFVESAERSIAASGRFVVALSGGSTPRRTYEQLALDEFASRVRWSQVHVIWGDERCVPPTDANSNYHMARETLLLHVPIPNANIHRIRGEGDPASAAVAYEAELRSLLQTPAGPPSVVAGRRIDLVLLGLGDNGHTASLFPESAAASGKVRWVMADEVDASPRLRITLTAPVLNAAAELMFLVSGAEKADVLARVLDGPRRPLELPAQLIVPEQGRVRWIVDTAAAASLARSA